MRINSYLITYKQNNMASNTFEVQGTDALYFRVDGDMHWSWCTATHNIEDGVLTISDKTGDCWQRLLDEKTGGTAPSMTYNSNTDKITIRIKDLIPRLLALYSGDTVEVVLDRETCLTHGPRVHREL